LRSSAHHRRLDSYVKRIKESEKKIELLEARLAEMENKERKET
jgi:hypothetical protein